MTLKMTSILNSSPHSSLSRTHSIPYTLVGNLKGRNHSKILFDEIDELACVLTDLHIQGASDPKDF